MAPSRLEEKLKMLGLSADDSGRSAPRGAAAPKPLVFRIYFPVPPFDGIQFNALKSGSGFNFTGQLLGVGGKQLQRIKQESGTRVEVVNRQGNLNGAHPDPLDKDLHALISADSLGKLQKAAQMVWELLQPQNARFKEIDVVPGGSVRLSVEKPKIVARAAQQAAQQEPGSRPPSVSPSTPLTPAATASSPAAFSNTSGSALTTPNSCSSRGCNSPTGGEEQGKTGSSTSADSSGSMRALFGGLEEFSLPPAAVPAASNGVADAATRHAEHASCTSANEQRGLHATQQLPEQQSREPGDIAHAGSSADAGGSLGHGSSCGPLPDSSVVQNERCSAGELPAPGPVPAASAALEEHVPEVAGGWMQPGQLSATGPQQRQEQPQQPQADEGPCQSLLQAEPSDQGSCSSCFQYGLGLCASGGGGGSSSWDAVSSCCVSKENPMLQALLADHEREQQQLQQQAMMMEQRLQVMALQQQAAAAAALGGPYAGLQPHLLPPINMGGFHNAAAPLAPEFRGSEGRPLMRSSLDGLRASNSFGPPSSLQQLQEQQHMLAMAAAAAADGFGMPPHGHPSFAAAAAAAGAANGAGGSTIFGSLPGMVGSPGPMFGGSSAFPDVGMGLGMSAPAADHGSSLHSREPAAWMAHQRQRQHQQAHMMCGGVFAGSLGSIGSPSIW